MKSLIRKVFFALLDWARKKTIEKLQDQFCDKVWIILAIKGLTVPVCEGNTRMDYVRSTKKLGDLERQTRKVISVTERQAGRIASSKQSRPPADHMAKMRTIGDKLIRLDANLEEVRNAKRAMLGLLD